MMTNNKTVYAVIQKPGSGFLGMILGGDELHVKANTSLFKAREVFKARYGKRIRFKKGPVTTSGNRAPYWFKG